MYTYKLVVFFFLLLLLLLLLLSLINNVVYVCSFCTKSATKTLINYANFGLDVRILYTPAFVAWLGWMYYLKFRVERLEPPALCICEDVGKRKSIWYINLVTGYLFGYVSRMRYWGRRTDTIRRINDVGRKLWYACGCVRRPKISSSWSSFIRGRRKSCKFIRRRLTVFHYHVFSLRGRLLDLLSPITL